MSKQIIFCTDGTWNSPDSDTNVYKLYKAIPITSNQVAFYDDGLGADGTPLEKLAGGAMGEGIFQKIKDGYTKIAHAYEQGDEIFLFGFSRGAFTARSLAGMIAVCGLPTGLFDDNLVETAFQAYRDKVQREVLLSSLGKYNLFDAKLTMVGVWDTVGALGIPALWGGCDPAIYGFLDTGLHPDVLNAYQALSIDERRREFPPTLWTSSPVPGQTIEQVWFSGVHCDVGGGYPETGLSDITLAWMIGKATALGLQINPSVQTQYGQPDAKNALAVLHTSWSIWWGFPTWRSIATNAVLANSAAIRCQYDTTYRPGSLSIPSGILATNYSLVTVVNPLPAQGASPAAPPASMSNPPPG